MLVFVVVVVVFLQSILVPNHLGIINKKFDLSMLDILSQNNSLCLSYFASVFEGERKRNAKVGGRMEKVGVANSTDCM